MNIHRRLLQAALEEDTNSITEILQEITNAMTETFTELSPITAHLYYLAAERIADGLKQAFPKAETMANILAEGLITSMTIITNKQEEE